jgi:hypothetical protein
LLLLVRKSDSLVSVSPFLVSKSDLLASVLLLLVKKRDFLVTISRLLVRKSDSLASISLLLVSKSDFLAADQARGSAARVTPKATTLLKILTKNVFFDPSRVSHE